MEHKVIYRITCKCRKVYIGSTGNYENRIHEHKSSCYNEKGKNYNLKIYKHIRNCCEWNELKFERLRHIFTDNPYKVEGYFIKLHNSFRNGLNDRYPLLDKEKIKEYQKEYRENNKEKRKDYDKEYRENNKEKLKKDKKKYHENNKEKIKEYQKKYRENNKEKIKEYKKKYHENNKEKTKEYQKKYREKMRKSQKEYP